MARGPKPTTTAGSMGSIVRIGAAVVWWPGALSARSMGSAVERQRRDVFEKRRSFGPRGAPASISSSDGTTRGGKRSSVGSSGAGFRFVAPKSLAGRGGGIGGCGRAGGWARQGKGSPQESSTVANMIVTLPIRSIGCGSFPVPPDRNAKRGHSGLRGRRSLYRLIPVRMLMTNAAILSPPF